MVGAADHGSGPSPPQNPPHTCQGGAHLLRVQDVRRCGGHDVHAGLPQARHCTGTQAFCSVFGVMHPTHGAGAQGLPGVPACDHGCWPWRRGDAFQSLHQLAPLPCSRHGPAPPHMSDVQSARPNPKAPPPGPSPMDAGSALRIATSWPTCPACSRGCGRAPITTSSSSTPC